MAIIYTYPTKTTLATNDLILISDSADSNKTKNATVTSIKDAIDVVDSITATSPLVASASTGAITLSIPAATSGVNGYLASSDWSTFNGKQVELQSGVNIKTINSNSILGSGDLAISGTGLSIFDDGSGVGLNISKLDFIGNGVSAAVDGSDNTKTNITISGTPADGSTGQVQYNDGSNGFAASANITIGGVPNIFSVKNIIRARALDNNQGKIELFSNDDAESVSIQGPPNGGSSYEIRMPNAVGTANQVLKLPSTIPGSGASQLVWGDATGGDTYALQAESKSGTSVPLKLDANSGTDSTVNLTEGTNITLTRNSSSQITIASTSSGGISPFPIYQASDSVSVGGQTIVRQSVCETASTCSKLEYFSVGTISYPVYFAIYTGAITAAGSAAKRLEGYNSTSTAGINVINFSGSYSFLAGQDIVIVVSLQDTGSLAGSSTLLNHVDISRGAAVYTSSFPSTLDILLDSIPSAVATGVCTHIY